MRHAGAHVPHPLHHCLCDLLATPVMPPPNPRSATVITGGANRPESTSLQYAHNVETVEFNTFQNMDCALCQQLMGANEDNFSYVLHMPHMCYSRSSTLYLLTQLYTTYTLITNADWLANDNRFREAYAPTDPSWSSSGRLTTQSCALTLDPRRTQAIR